MNRIEMMKERLRQFGYDVKAEDEPILNYTLDKAVNTILNETHQRRMPSALERITVDRAVGEFLLNRKTFAPAQLKSLDFEPAIKQLQEGDTNTVFSTGEGTLTDEQRLTAFINYLIGYGKDEIYHYRRLVW